MSIETTITKRVEALRSQHPNMSEPDLLSAIFKRDPDLYWQYRQASLSPEAETPSTSIERYLTPALKIELLRTAEAFDGERPLSSGLEKLRQVLRKARQG